MTATEVAALGGAFASFVQVFSGCFSNRRTFENFVTYCRGLLGKIRRKSRCARIAVVLVQRQVGS